MHEITIYRQYFTNANCYKSGVKQEPKGVQVHSTGANNPYLKRYVSPNDGRLGENKNKNSHNQPGLSVCANAYIGKLDNGVSAIYQTLPWEYRCWLSGSAKNGNANKLGYIGFEICEDNKQDKKYFEEVVMGLSVKLVAYLCKKYDIPIDMIHDHQELAKMGLASSHADILHWLEIYNLTVDDYRAAVKQAMEEGVHVTYVENDTTWTDGDEKEKTSFLCQAVTYANNSYPINMRQEPDSKSTLLVKIPQNTMVDVIKEYDDIWVNVQYNNYIGYVMRNFLIFENEINTQEPISDNNITKEHIIIIREKIMELLNIVDKLLEQL